MSEVIKSGDDDDKVERIPDNNEIAPKEAEIEHDEEGTHLSERESILKRTGNEELVIYAISKIIETKNSEGCIYLENLLLDINTKPDYIENTILSKFKENNINIQSAHSNLNIISKYIDKYQNTASKSNMIREIMEQVANSKSEEGISYLENLFYDSSVDKIVRLNAIGRQAPVVPPTQEPLRR